MTDGQIGAIATMVVAAFGALGLIGTKLVERKPARERRSAEDAVEAERRRNVLEEHALDLKNLRAKLDVVLGMLEVRDKHGEAQDAAIARHQEEIERLQASQLALRSKLAKLMGAIDRSQIRFPETREFWDHELGPLG